MSPNKEDYLKAILLLSDQAEIVSNKQISQAMSVSAASVTEMNSRLVADGYLTSIPYKGVQLTDQGRLTARQLLRKHRIWEVFLQEKLGYEWHEVHEEAERLEHFASDRLVDRLDAFLGYPSQDPHGSPIPKEDGSLPASDGRQLLSDFQVGETVEVVEFKDSPAILNYLKDKGVQLGDRYTIKTIEPFDGPFHLQGSDQATPLILSLTLVQHIYAQKRQP